MTAATNWIQIRSEYLHGAESLRAVASRFGIPAGTLLARAASENWAEQRNRIQSSAVEAAEDSARQTLLGTLRREQEIDLSCVARLRLLWNDLLLETSKPNDLKALAQALATIQTVVRTTLNIPAIPLRLPPSPEKALRDYTQQELIESLIMSPAVRAELIRADKDPSIMSDQQIVDFCLQRWPSRLG
jgi:transposase-like protein